MLGLGQNLSTPVYSVDATPYETLEVSTLAATDVGPTSATFNGSFSGGQNVTTYIELSLSSDLSASIFFITDIQNSSPFYYFVSGLPTGETYYYRAVAIDSISGTVLGSILSVSLVGAPDRVSFPVPPILTWSSSFTPGSSLTNRDYFVPQPYSTDDLEVLASVSDDQTPAIEKTNVLKAQAKYHPHFDQLGVRLASANFSSDTLNTLVLSPSTDYVIQFNMYLPDTNETSTNASYFAIGPESPGASNPFVAIKLLTSDYTASDVGSWQFVYKEFSTPASVDSETDQYMFIYAANDDSVESNDIFYINDIKVLEVV